MAIAVTLRNRIVGFLIIISILLIALPALLGRSPQQTPDDAKALAGHGSVSSDLNLAEPDYSSLLAPEDDSSHGLISENPELLAELTGANSSAPTTPSAAAAGQDNVEQLSFTNDNPPQRTAVTEPAVSSDKPQEEVLVAANARTNTAPAAPAASPAPASAPAAAPQAAPSAASSSGTGGFTVQVGVFSQKSNADRVMNILRNAGITPRSETVTSEGREMIRIYAGDGDRSSLESLVSKIDEAAGVKARIVPK